MGFGILFFGYFLLLNVTNPAYTDLICGLITVMAFYKLSTVNKYFRMSVVPAVLFAVFGTFELFAEFADMIGISLSDISEYLPAPRFILIGILTITMLLGIEDVAREVDVPETRSRVKFALPTSYVIFPLCAILEFPAITNLIPDGLPIAIVSTVSLIFMFVVMVCNIITIYSAYMHICMPEDVDNETKEKPSRFGFVNKFREHENEKAREYAEYKLDKMRKKANKKRRK